MKKSGFLYSIIKYFEKNDVLLKNIIIIVISLLVLLFARFLYKKHLIKKTGKKGEKIAYGVGFSIVQFIYVIFIIITLLEYNGINVRSLVTGLGILSAVVGLALQDLLKDILMGIRIVNDKFFMIGDVVKYGEVEGEILSFNLKTTQIQDLTTKNILSVCNRNIYEVQKVSGLLDIDISFPYDGTLEKVREVINEISSRTKGIKGVKECGFVGVQEFAESAVKYKLRIKCMPLEKLQIRRDINGIIKVVFEENNIIIPYNQLDVHLDK